MSRRYTLAASILAADLARLGSVNPGFCGQPFIETTYPNFRNSTFVFPEIRYLASLTH
jgi:pentose-5-phosphate-3-epimerase